MSTDMQSSSQNETNSSRFDNIMPIIDQLSEMCTVALQGIATELASEMKEIITKNRQNIDDIFLLNKFQSNTICENLNECRQAIRQMQYEFNENKTLISDVYTDKKVIEYTVRTKKLEKCIKNSELPQKAKDIFDTLRKLMNECKIKKEEINTQIAARMTYLIDNHVSEINNEYLNNIFKSDKECIKLLNEKSLVNMIYADCDFIISYFDATKLKKTADDQQLFDSIKEQESKEKKEAMDSYNRAVADYYEDTYRDEDTSSDEDFDTDN